MLNSKKIAAAVGVLGSFALIGVGAVPAFASGSSSQCVSEGYGKKSCTQVRERQVTTDKNGNVTVVNDTVQNCPAANGRISCVSTFNVPGA